MSASRLSSALLLICLIGLVSAADNAAPGRALTPSEAKAVMSALFGGPSTPVGGLFAKEPLALNRAPAQEGLSAEVQQRERGGDVEDEDEDRHPHHRHRHHYRHHHHVPHGHEHSRDQAAAAYEKYYSDPRFQQQFFPANFDQMRSQYFEAWAKYWEQLKSKAKEEARKELEEEKEREEGDDDEEEDDDEDEDKKRDSDEDLPRFKSKRPKNHKSHRRHDDDDEDEERENRRSSKKEEKAPAPLPRNDAKRPGSFIESFAESTANHLAYGNPLNSVQVVENPASMAAPQANAGYMAPMDAAVMPHPSGFNALAPQAVSHQYGSVSALLGGNYRFREQMHTQAHNTPARPSAEQYKNVNPLGTPTPFYSPTAPLPPAPNQVPINFEQAPQTYPDKMEMTTSGAIPWTAADSAQPPTQSTMAPPLSNNAPQPAGANNYPFGSFLEVESLELPSEVHAHPHLHALGNHPLRSIMRAPLLEEHTQEFPLL